METITIFGFRVPLVDIFVLLCTLGYGIYAVSTWAGLRKKGQLFQNSLLIPAGHTSKECRNQAEYLRLLGPRLLIFGVLLIVLGLFNFVWPIYVTAGNLPYLLGLVGICPILVLLIWFSIMLKKLHQNFWRGTERKGK